MKTLSSGSRTRGKNCVKMPPTLGYTSKRRRNSKDNKRSKPRKLMRPWLEELLDNGLCRGARWINKSSGMFSVDWRHGSRGGFNPVEHSEVFNRWAQHTGKLKDGEGLDHSKNKSTFRCALHSLKDCIEHTKDGDKKGACAKRTFQFIEPGHPEYDSKKKAKSAKKNKIQLKEETLDSTAGTDEQDTRTLDYEHVVSDQGTSTWDFQPNIEIVDSEHETRPWWDLPEETGRSASSTYPSSPLVVEEIIVNPTFVAGDSFVVQNTVRNTTSPAGVSAGTDVMPVGLPGRFQMVCSRSVPVPDIDDLLQRCSRRDAQALDQPQTNVVLVQGLQETHADNESSQSGTAARSLLPVFSELGVSVEYGDPFCHTGLKSGGNVKVNKSEELLLSSQEIVIKHLVFNSTAPATVSDGDGSSSAEIGSECPDIDFMNFNEKMDSNNTTEVESLDNMSLDDYLSDRQNSPLAEEINIISFANYVFADNEEENASEIFLPDE